MPTFLYLSSGVVLATVIAYVCDLTLKTDLNLSDWLIQPGKPIRAVYA